MKLQKVQPIRWRKPPGSSMQRLVSSIGRGRKVAHQLMPSQVRYQSYLRTFKTLFWSEMTFSRRTAIPARDLLRMERDREQEVASTDAVQARLEARERDSKYAPMYMTPNRIA